MLDSGGSTCFYDISSGQMAGACINTIWTVDQDIGKLVFGKAQFLNFN